MPGYYSYAHFVEMFLEMTVGVGIIILLFEASQSQLQLEMQRLVESDSQVKEMGIRDRLTGLYNRHYFNDVIRRELARSRRSGALSVLLIDTSGHPANRQDHRACRRIRKIRRARAGSSPSTCWSAATR